MPTSPFDQRTEDGRLASWLTEYLVKETADNSEPVDIAKVYETAYTMVRIARRAGWAPTNGG